MTYRSHVYYNRLKDYKVLGIKGDYLEIELSNSNGNGLDKHVAAFDIAHTHLENVIYISEE